MKRTVATARPLCDALSLDMQLRDGLKEIRYGKWEGQTVDFVKQHYLSDYLRWLAEPSWNPPTEGETAVEIANRSGLVIREIYDRYADGNVLVVSLTKRRFESYSVVCWELIWGATEIAF